MKVKRAGHPDFTKEKGRYERAAIKRSPMDRAMFEADGPNEAVGMPPQATAHKHRWTRRRRHGTAFGPSRCKCGATKPNRKFKRVDCATVDDTPFNVAVDCRRSLWRDSRFVSDMRGKKW